jgi:hypothetical protein
VLALALTGPAGAQVLDALVASEPLLGNPHFDVLVVTVVEMRDEGATNAAPPRGRVRVEQTLRGRPRRGEAAAVWQPPVRHADLEPAPSGRPAPSRPTAEWQRRPLAAPGAGERVLVFALPADDGVLRVQSWAVYRATPENVATARRHMAPAERSWWLQGPIAVVLLALPVAGIVGLVRRRRWTYALPLAAGALYAYYESGISIYSNIRVDLLLLWPALGATVLVALLALALDLAGRVSRRAAS